jgi:CheY-like chemotaxis protein
VIEVADDGVGIEPEQIARIFNAFEQGERTVTRRFGGLGLGLAITRSLVEMHRGSISVHSEGRGKGATFRVVLGIVPQQAAEAAAGAATAAPKTPARELRILLVDDHEDTRRVLARLLAKRGHRVEVADTVATANAWLDRATFDILVSDIGLPDKTGHELMTHARAAQPQLRGIALSGFGMEEDIRRSREAGFDFHLTKPVDFPALLDLLEKLDQKPPRKD